MAASLTLTHWLERIWYGNRPLERSLLSPLSRLFCQIARRRRQRLTARQQAFAAPVVVVGNISVGGTGKTPLTLRLAQLLQQNGYQPGMVSRGYGAHPDRTMIRPVTYHNKPADVGDEALLLATRSGLPVVVGIQRSRAVEYLLENYDVDIVLSDDGLQHYAMARDLEIAVVDGARRFGNGRCLPAGPLREPVERLQDCDFVICNGQPHTGEYGMQLSGNWLVSLSNPKMLRPLNDLAGQPVHVLTAIGNPTRFIDSLRVAGIEVTPHLYPDHYLFQGHEWQFADDHPVLMTEKDAVKCRQFAPERLLKCWYLPVDAQPEPAFEQAFLQRIQELMNHGQKTAGYSGLPGHQGQPDL
ncbi:MAG: tetraacyldisaccharide 4'-kinase [Thiolinea sp.]